MSNLQQNKKDQGEELELSPSKIVGFIFLSVFLFIALAIALWAYSKSSDAQRSIIETSSITVISSSSSEDQ